MRVSEHRRNGALFNGPLGNMFIHMESALGLAWGGSRETSLCFVSLAP